MCYLLCDVGRDPEAGRDEGADSRLELARLQTETFSRHARHPSGPVDADGETRHSTTKDETDESRTLLTALLII